MLKSMHSGDVLGKKLCDPAGFALSGASHDMKNNFAEMLATTIAGLQQKVAGMDAERWNRIKARPWRRKLAGDATVTMETDGIEEYCKLHGDATITVIQQ